MEDPKRKADGPMPEPKKLKKDDDVEDGELSSPEHAYRPLSPGHSRSPTPKKLSPSEEERDGKESTSKHRSRSRDRKSRKKRDRSRSRGRKSKDRSRSRSSSRERRKHKSRDKDRSRRSGSRDRSKDRKKERSRSRDRERRKESSRSKDRDRKKHRSRSRDRKKRHDRSRSASGDRRRSRDDGKDSRRKRTRSPEREREKRSRRSRSRSRSKDKHDRDRGHERRSERDGSGRNRDRDSNRDRDGDKDRDRDGRSDRGGSRRRDRSPDRDRDRDRQRQRDHRSPDRSRREHENGAADKKNNRESSSKNQPELPSVAPEQVVSVDEEYEKKIQQQLEQMEDSEDEEERLIRERREARQRILQKHKSAPNTPMPSPPMVTPLATPMPSPPAADSPPDQPVFDLDHLGNDAREVQEDEKEYDMFSDSPSEALKARNINGKVLQKTKSFTAAIDNHDDAEGYYIFKIGDVLNDRYEVVSQYGSGVFSTVLKVADRQDRPLQKAVKIIRSNDLMYRAGQKELEILKLLSDNDEKGEKHVVRMTDHFEHKNHLCIVFEPMHMNLREVLKKYGKGVGIKIDAVRVYARQLFVALKHMRQCGILHADLKPDNILVNQSNSVIKVCDFGSASTTREPNEITPYLVSRFYRAPEIMVGLKYDTGIDMWSAGCCLYELFTGKILFAGRSNNEMLKAHMDIKGRFPTKLLRQGAFVESHFDLETNKFLQEDQDPVTKATVIKEVQYDRPVKDLEKILQAACVPGSLSDEKHRKKLHDLKDLLDRCLQFDPAKRLTPEQALKHSFCNVKTVSK